MMSLRTLVIAAGYSITVGVPCKHGRYLGDEDLLRFGRKIARVVAV